MHPTQPHRLYPNASASLSTGATASLNTGATASLNTGATVSLNTGATATLSTRATATHNTSLGNVRTTITDRKLATFNNWNITGYTADITSANDYFPFGSEMPGRSYNSGDYRYGFNGKEKDDEVAGTGNQYDYGFRIYNPRLGRFLSVDPLSKSYPALSAYQFAANMPIWAKDLDGLEALIVNLNDKTATFVANIYFVTQGEGQVFDSQLKKASEDLIVNQLSAEARSTLGTTFSFELNYISSDENGAPLTYAKAGEMAENSSITHTTSTGEKIVVEGPETGIVITSSNKLSENNPGIFIPKEINPDGDFNVIQMNERVVNKFDQTKAQKTFVHELGHYLGRRGAEGIKADPQKGDHAGGFGGTNPGITSRKDENIRIVPEDLPKMYNGAKQYGKQVIIEKKE